MMDEILINPYERIDQYETDFCFARYKIKAYKTIYIQNDRNSIMKKKANDIDIDNDNDNDEFIDDNNDEFIDIDDNNKPIADEIAKLNQKFNNFQKSLIKMQEKLNEDKLKEKSKSRINYGYGPEFEKLKKMPHYRQPYVNCPVYHALGRPSKDFMNKLGDEYNKFFHIYILSRKMPKFNRNHKRNLGLAVWFFEDIFPMIYPWLKARGFINFNKND